MNSRSTDWFVGCRYGMFVHYGLFSLLGRGEWAFNREEIPRGDYLKLADQFGAEKFDAEALCDLAVVSGMRYLVFTTMHHDGFRLYDSKLSQFTAPRSKARRDLVSEIVSAARRRGLKIALYHSLNNWIDTPDAVDALEDTAACRIFIKNTFERIRELVTLFNPIDVLWYDGWWPFNAEGWQAEQMNAMVREIQPHILFNGRNGLPGDFATPEGHMGFPRPWRPWEAGMTLNNSWGYHTGDTDWKSPRQVIDLLAQAASGRGNLLLNVGPRGDGSLPQASVEILKAVGGWLAGNKEAIYDTDYFTFQLQERGADRGDWNHLGPVTAKGNCFYWLIRRWPGSTAVLGGVRVPVRRVTWLQEGREVEFQQTGTRIVLRFPDSPLDSLCPVLKFECEGAPRLYQTGGMRVPRVNHPHYDPCPSDIVQ